MSETIVHGKSNGAAGPPLARKPRKTVTAAPVVLTRPKPINTPGKANSALKEPAPELSERYKIDHPAAAHVEIVDRELGIVKPSGRMNIAICGFASSSRGFAPVNDPNWEIWGLNQLYRHMPRADRWFDIHKVWNAETVPNEDYGGWIKECGIPFYMYATEPDMPTTVRYPIERLCAKFNDYFTSTIAYMLALAIDEIDMIVDAKIVKGALRERVEEGMGVRDALASLYAEHSIGIFGVDLVVGEEYFWQKACAEWWIGVACARGITMVLPPQTALCKQMYRYGYQTEPESMVKKSEFLAFSAKMRKERDELMKQLYLRDGALQASEQFNELFELRERGADVDPRF